VGFFFVEDKDASGVLNFVLQEQGALDKNQGGTPNTDNPQHPKQNPPN
jgi:hypothetical protein